jgi:hypothetical protein
MKGKIMFYSDMRVIVSPDAFPGSTDGVDERARGRLAHLIHVLDEEYDADGNLVDALWYAKSEAGDVIAPLESELLVI